MQIVRELNKKNEAAGIKSIAKLEKEIFPDAWSERAIAETLEQPTAFAAVAEDNGVIVGYCIVYYALDEGEIARIAVESSVRRMGTGKKILDFVGQSCLRKGVTRILLDVRESNETARTFYENYGFCVDGIRKNFYDFPKEHAVLMSMNIFKS